MQVIYVCVYMSGMTVRADKLLTYHRRSGTNIWPWATTAALCIETFCRLV